MAEDFVQIAPDSTGAKLRTRSRVIGANTVEEQYVIALQSDAVPINRAWLSTLRIPSTASLAAGSSQNLFSVWNGIASGGNSINFRRLSAEIDTSVVHAAASPVLRMFRTTTASSGGTAITPVQQYTAEPVINSLVSVRAAHAADGVASAITNGTISPAQALWSQTMPRLHSAIGFQMIGEYNLLPNDSNLMAVDPLILRPQEGVVIQLQNPAALPATAGAFTVMIKAVIAEFTYP